MTTAAIARSLLFVPGNRPNRFAKAAASGAHSIVLDLEDAVSLDDKDNARQAVAEWLQQGRGDIVRINAAGTPWHEADLDMLRRHPATVLMLPKAEAESTAYVAAALPRHPLIALVETVRGYMELAKLAAVPGLQRMAFGSIDFGVESGIADIGDAMTPVRTAIVLESRFAGLSAPIDGVSTSIDDGTAIRDDTLRSRQLGFGGKLCIHPKQVSVVNEAFLPTRAEADWARRVLAAVEASNGSATAVDGKMVDKPVVDQARSILANAPHNVS